MKLFIASDIHGSETNLEKFFKIVDENIDSDTKVVLLGDIYNHGPRNPFPEGYAPMRVAKLLNDAMTFLSVIKGNCDSEVDEMISNFPIIGDFSMEWGNRTVYFTHGHKVNPDNPIRTAKSGDIVLYGHFHKAGITDINGVKYICVGAIGLCKEDTKLSYAILYEDKLVIKALDFDEVLLELLF